MIDGGSRLFSRLKIKMTLLICLLFISSLILFQNLNANNAFKLGIEENAECVYEYRSINTDLLNKLAQENYSYAGLLLVENGIRIKWVLSEVEENFNYWLITIRVYRGSSFQNYVDSFKAHVFKDILNFSNELFSGILSVKFIIPKNVSVYLQGFNNTIPSSFKNISYSYNKSIIFDYLVKGRNDTIVYTYNDIGLLRSYQILYNHTKVFDFVLVNYGLKGLDCPIWVIIIISIFSGVIIIVFFLLSMRRGRRQSKSKKVLKLLRKIK